jgi:ATP-dependent helicase/nuclease subunit A
MSADAARLASTPEVSAWVGANAGSGKTWVLSSRVIRLLLDGADPGRLLCLTYTKAAAAEMRARVFEVLGRWATLDAVTVGAEIAEREGAAPDEERLSRARTLFARALETPGGLKIETIHAFCQRLAGRFAVEAGVSLPIRIAEDTETLREAALASVLQGPGMTARIARLSRFVDLDSFDRLTKGDVLRTIARAGTADPWAGSGLEPGLTGGSVRTRALAQTDWGQIRAAAAALASGSKTDKERAAALEFAFDASHPDSAFAALRAALLTQGGEILKKLATKAVGETHPWLVPFLAGEARRVLEASGLAADAEGAEALDAALALIAGVEAAFEAAKRRAGVLDYDDLIAIASRLLTASEARAWVLFKLDGGLDHILVDEAQDTSPEQWSVIAALAGEFFAGEGAREPAPGRPRTIFAVGDEKQSIFGFQGADPGVFASQRAHFEAAAKAAGRRFERPVLNLSRRSAPQVLAFADALFADPVLAGRASHDPWAPHLAHRAEAKGQVELWPLIRKQEKGEDQDPWTDPVDRTPDQSPQARLAAAIAGFARGAIGRGSVEDEGRMRPLAAGDILVLVQQRGPLWRAILRKLKEAGVAVAGADRLDLGGHLAVKDLVAAGRFTLLPEDDLNLAALLKSPLVGLSEEALFALASGRAPGETLAARVEAQALRALGPVREAWARLVHWRDLAGRTAPFDFYARLLGPGGGRRRLIAQLGGEAEEVIDAFLGRAEAHESETAPSLERFLHEVERTQDSLKRELEGKAAGVRVMTVHGAKGLEAPLVILADTARKSAGKTKPAILPLHDGLVWQQGAGPAAAAALAAWEARAAAENARLLYVAATRARDRLIVCGATGQKKLPEDSWYAAAEAAFARLTPAREIETAAGPGRVYGAAEADLAMPDLGLREGRPALPEALRRPLPAPPLVSRVSPSRALAARPGETGGNAAAIRRGLLVHRLLQSLPDLDAGAREAAALRFLEVRAPGLPAAERAELARDLARLLEEPAFALLFAPGSRAEVPVAGVLSALPGAPRIGGQIDRLAVAADEVLIVDYKTDARPPETSAGVKPAYVLQMALYREVLKPLWPGRAVACVLLYTGVPKLIRLETAQLDAAFADYGARDFSL